MSFVPPASPPGRQVGGPFFATAGHALRVLATGPDHEVRHRAAVALLTFAPDDKLAGIRRAWSELGPSGAELVPRLVKVAVEDPSCLIVEVAGTALGAQGKEGLDEVLVLCRHHDFVVRMGAYLGLEAAGSAARIAVDRICGLIVKEPASIVARIGMDALSAIGGAEATTFLETVAADEDLRQARRTGVGDAQPGVPVVRGDRPEPPRRTAGGRGPDIDLRFRPDYWDLPDPTALILQNVKGAMRREMLLDLLGHSIPFDAFMIVDHMEPAELLNLAVTDPRWRGGEYLPQYKRGEVEIARIVMASPTLDVVSIRARRRNSGRICHRVVDDRGSRYRCAPRTSADPLTLAEMICLVDSITDIDRAAFQPEGLLRALWRGRLKAHGPWQASVYARVESVVYPPLGDWYRSRAAAWAANHDGRQP